MKQVPALHLAGYRVVNTSGKLPEDAKPGGSYIGLAIALLNGDGNELQRSPDFVRFPDVAENYPELARARLLASAMCRYLTTGGQNVSQMVAAIHQGLLELPTVGLAEGWKLWSTEEQGYHEHIFKKDQRYLRTVEDQFTEELTEAEFLSAQTGAPKEVFEALGEDLACTVSEIADK